MTIAARAWISASLAVRPASHSRVNPGSPRTARVASSPRSDSARDTGKVGSTASDAEIEAPAPKSQAADSGSPTRCARLASAGRE